MLENIVSILLGVTVLAVLAVLFLGLFSMAKGGAFSKKYGNSLMRARIATQFLAVVLLLVVYLLWRH
jgi:hypothetical protein